MPARQYICTGARHDIREKNFTNMMMVRYRRTTIPSQLPCPHCINYTASPAGDDDKGGICHELIVADTNAMSGPKGNSHVNKSSPLRRVQLSTNEGRRGGLLPGARQINIRGSELHSLPPSTSTCGSFTSCSHVSRLVFQCTWPSCGVATSNCTTIETHVRKVHLGPKLEDSELSDHEEEFYYTELELRPHTYSPPTMSHRDMARPPHEDPEYQKQLKLGVFRASPINIPSTGGVPWSSAATSPNSPQKHLKLSPRPYNTNGGNSVTLLSLSAPNKIPVSPTRKVRGDTKKCRKVYGMEHRELWCTQCKWKKACTRSLRGSVVTRIDLGSLCNTQIHKSHKQKAITLSAWPQMSKKSENTLWRRTSNLYYSARNVELSDVDNVPKRAQISEEGMDSGIVAHTSL
uniref:C2H2-type domain-containing protein n=1 Tax=Timema poppense TaxID=170557 RepID=A0A7R9D3J7_TIMPO|nr:unnamed protein product [Timema poppensis]